jgi:RES domain-containing protein
MLVYHTGKTIHARDLTGKGAELFGGRWNAIGIPCVYTSATKSLSVLEYAANVKLSQLPKQLSITACKIPDNCWKEFPVASLPADWQQRPFTGSTVKFGSALLLKKEWLALKVPSVIIPGEFNYILNPLHADFKKIKIVSVEAFLFDQRIKE